MFLFDDDMIHDSFFDSWPISILLPEEKKVLVERLVLCTTKKFHTFLPETNIFSLKIGGWEMILSFWEGPIFRGKTVSFGVPGNSVAPSEKPGSLLCHASLGDSKF